jgi:NADH:ubiquinone oxidoreductase subunit H
MPNRALYAAICVLAVLTVVLGYKVYQDRRATTGVEINVGPNGIAIEKK